MDPGCGSAVVNSCPFYHLKVMIMIPMIAAIGYSILYLILGGVLGGAVLIFLIAKALGK